MDEEAPISPRCNGSAEAPEPERFFFVHLQKTAGASLTRMLKDYFGIDAVYPNRNDGDDVPVSMVMVPHLLERWRARRDEIRVIAGHFPLCTMELLDAPFRTLTVLREPVERTLSCLRFHKKITPEDRHLPLDAIYDDPFRFNGFLHNHMVKMFALTRAEMNAGAVSVVDFTNDRLERAKDNLRAMDAVGLQERFDDLRDTLRRTFGWELGDAPRINHTKPEPVSGELRERITHDNALDIELYNFAVDLCRQRARASKGQSDAIGVDR